MTIDHFPCFVMISTKKGEVPLHPVDEIKSERPSEKKSSPDYLGLALLGLQALWFNCDCKDNLQRAGSQMLAAV
jgi:hypothetical protein